MSRLLAVAFLVLILIGGILFFQKDKLALFKNSQDTASSSANFSPSSSWKDYVRQIIANRADITITSGNLYVQLTPVNQSDWHVIIKPNEASSSATTTIVSKKMNLNISQPSASVSAPLPDNFSLDTTIPTSHLQTLLMTLPDSK